MALSTRACDVTVGAVLDCRLVSVYSASNRGARRRYTKLRYVCDQIFKNPNRSKHLNRPKVAKGIGARRNGFGRECSVGLADICCWRISVVESEVQTPRISSFFHHKRWYNHAALEEAFFEATSRHCSSLYTNLHIKLSKRSFNDVRFGLFDFGNNYCVSNDGQKDKDLRVVMGVSFGIFGRSKPRVLRSSLPDRCPGRLDRRTALGDI